MGLYIFSAMLLNIGLLILVAQILARIKTVRKVIVQDGYILKDQLILILIFSSIVGQQGLWYYLTEELVQTLERLRWLV